MPTNAEVPIKEELKERLRHPIIGSIALSFFLWNWKIPVALIFGPDPGDPYTGRISLIQKYVSEIDWYHIKAPILSAIVYLIFSHVIGFLYFRYWESRWIFEREKKKQEDLQDLNEIEIYRRTLKQILEQTRGIYNDFKSNTNEVISSYNQANGIDKQRHVVSLISQLQTVHNASEKWLEQYHAVFGARSKNDQIWPTLKGYKEKMGKKFKKIFGFN